MDRCCRPDSLLGCRPSRQVAVLSGASESLCGAGGGGLALVVEKDQVYTWSHGVSAACTHLDGCGAKLDVARGGARGSISFALRFSPNGCRRRCGDSDAAVVTSSQFMSLMRHCTDIGPRFRPVSPAARLRERFRDRAAAYTHRDRRVRRRHHLATLPSQPRWWSDRSTLESVYRVFARSQ